MTTWGGGERGVPSLGSASPFNVTVDNVTLAAFTEGEVGELCAQHTADTGQRFESAAVARICELSAGHPWLVNALADQCTRRDVPDRAVAITPAHVESAKETLILERRTHIDSLLARLREDRVRRVLDPMLAGGTTADEVLDDDFAYVVSLGLIRREGARWVVSNAESSKSWSGAKRLNGVHAVMVGVVYWISFIVGFLWLVVSSDVLLCPS